MILKLLKQKYFFASLYQNRHLKKIQGGENILNACSIKANLLFLTLLYYSIFYCFSWRFSPNDDNDVKHRVSLSSISKQWYPLAARCNGHSRITLDAIWSDVPHLQINVKASHICAWMTGIFQHECQGRWVVPVQVWSDQCQVACQWASGQEA